MLALVSWSGDGLAQGKVGVTSAVVPASRGQAPQAAPRVLRIGEDVMANERVTTDAAGRTQLLFMDGSALTLGPDSDVVIDEFVYDPATKTGKLAFSATKGVFRLIGGKISKQDEVLLRTPTATIGIRGGIAMASVTPGQVNADFIFGTQMSVTGGGGQQIANRPGSRISQVGNGPPLPPVQTPAGAFAAALSQTEGNQPQANNPVSDSDVAGSQISNLSSGQGANTPTPDAQTGAADTAGTDGVTSFASQQSTTAQASSGFEGSGSIITVVTPPTAPPTALPVVGRAKHATVPATGTDDPTTANNVGLSGTFVGSTFSAVSDTSQPFSINIGTGTFAASSTAQPFGTSVLTGSGLLSPDGEFVFYHLTDSVDGHKVIAFAGVPSTSIPLSGGDIYTLGEDFVRANDIAFAEHFTTAQHGNAYINWDNSGGNRPFAGGVVYLTGMGTGQQSSAYAMFGSVQNDSLGQPHIQAKARGQSKTSSTAQSILFGGGVSSSDAFGGTDFFGTTPKYFVLEATTVLAGDNLVSRGYTRTFQELPTTVFPNVAAARIGADTASRTSRTINGFIAGVDQQFSGPNILNNLGFNNFAPAGFSITSNALNGTLSASVNYIDPFERSIAISLGEATPTGRSAFINDRVFAAESTVINVSGLPVSGNLVLTTAADLVTSGFIPAGVSLCTCTFLTTGFLFGDRQDFNLSPNRTATQLATWVAGVPSSAGQLVGIAPASATYSGHLFGTVVNGSAVYQAIGGISLGFSFGAGNFQFTSVDITNFDGTNYSKTAAPGPGFATNSYSSNLAGLLPITGTHPTVGAVAVVVSGAFFGPLTPPDNTGGVAQGFGTSYSFNATYAAQR